MRPTAAAAAASDEPRDEQQRRRRLRRKPTARDPNAPKPSRTGYMIFLAERRRGLREANPDFTLNQMNALLGSEWSGMRDDEKQTYLKKAADEKREYDEQLQVYKGTDAFKQFERQKRSNPAKSEADTVNLTRLRDDSIPIYSKEFMAQNQQSEAVLRELRKDAARHEEEQVHLESHVAQLRATVAAMEDDAAVRRALRRDVGRQLESWRSQVASALAHLPLRGAHAAPVDVVVEFLNDARAHPAQDADLAAKVRKVCQGLKLA